MITADTIMCNRLVASANVVSELEGRISAAVQSRDELNKRALVAASIGPVDVAAHCANEIVASYEEQVGRALSAGVDLLLLETMTSIAAATIAIGVIPDDVPFAVSFYADNDGNLPSGEPLEGAAAAVAGSNAIAVGLNCVAVSAVDGLVARLAKACQKPLLVCPSINNEVERRDFPDVMRRLKESFGIAIAGSCCGSTPDDTRRLCEALS